MNQGKEEMKKKKQPKYKCGDCGWVDTTEYGMDKCPDCGGDDWRTIRPKKRKKKMPDELKDWKWPVYNRHDGKKEYSCPHGIGHGEIHSCDGCCQWMPKEKRAS